MQLEWLESQPLADCNQLSLTETLIGSLALPNEFRTLRAKKNGAVSDEPGPYEQTKEPFGAFFIVEAENMDEAVRIARLHPGTHLGDMMAGGIEIRPIEMLERCARETA